MFCDVFVQEPIHSIDSVVIDTSLNAKPKNDARNVVLYTIKRFPLWSLAWQGLDAFQHPYAMFDCFAQDTTFLFVLQAFFVHDGLRMSHLMDKVLLRELAQVFI